MVCFFSKGYDQLKNFEQLQQQEMKVMVEAENSQGPKKFRQFEVINYPILLKKHLIKQSVIRKQEKTIFITYFLAENFKSVGVSDIYLFFELRGNF